MRDGISQLINQQADLEVCGTASSAPEALEALNVSDPDLLLVDISLKGMDGIELIKIVKKRKGGCPCSFCPCTPRLFTPSEPFAPGQKDMS